MHEQYNYSDSIQLCLCGTENAAARFPQVQANNLVFWLLLTSFTQEFTFLDGSSYVHIMSSAGAHSDIISIVMPMYLLIKAANKTYAAGA